MGAGVSPETVTFTLLVPPTKGFRRSPWFLPNPPHRPETSARGDPGTVHRPCQTSRTGCTSVRAISGFLLRHRSIAWVECSFRPKTPSGTKGSARVRNSLHDTSSPITQTHTTRIFGRGAATGRNPARWRRRRTCRKRSPIGKTGPRTPTATRPSNRETGSQQAGRGARAGSALVRRPRAQVVRDELLGKSPRAAGCFE